MLRLSLLIPVCVAMEHQRVISAFTWQVTQLTDYLDEADLLAQRSQRFVHVIAAVMDEVFDCSETDAYLPDSNLTKVVRDALHTMNSRNSLEVPEALLALLSPEYSRMEVCSELLKRMYSAQTLTEERSAPKLSVITAVAWYETQIGHLHHSLWGTAHPVGIAAQDTGRISQLVREIEHLQSIMERYETIRGLVSRNRGFFESAPKEADATLPLKGKTLKGSLMSAVENFLQDMDADQLEASVKDIFMRTPKIKPDFLETELTTLAKLVTRRDRSATRTRIFSLESILVRGTFYTKKSKLADH
jgi:hypothetical protein